MAIAMTSQHDKPKRWRDFKRVVVVMAAAGFTAATLIVAYQQSRIMALQKQLEDLRAAIRADAEKLP